LSAIPPSLRGGTQRERVRITGRQPSPLNPPSGCRFRTRCPMAQAICEQEDPALTTSASDPAHSAACHFAFTTVPPPRASAERAGTGQTGSHEGTAP